MILSRLKTFFIILILFTFSVTQVFPLPKVMLGIIGSSPAFAQTSSSSTPLISAEEASLRISQLEEAIAEITKKIQDITVPGGLSGSEKPSPGVQLYNESIRRTITDLNAKKLEKIKELEAMQRVVRAAREPILRPYKNQLEFYKKEILALQNNLEGKDKLGLNWADSEKGWQKLYGAKEGFEQWAKNLPPSIRQELNNNIKGFRSLFNDVDALFNKKVDWLWSVLEHWSGKAEPTPLPTDLAKAEPAPSPPQKTKPKIKSSKTPEELEKIKVYQEELKDLETERAAIEKDISEMKTKDPGTLESLQDKANALRRKVEKINESLFRMQDYKEDPALKEKFENLREKAKYLQFEIGEAEQNARAKIPLTPEEILGKKLGKIGGEIEGLAREVGNAPRELSVRLQGIMEKSENLLRQLHATEGLEGYNALIKERDHLLDILQKQIENLKTKGVYDTPTFEQELQKLAAETRALEENIKNAEKTMDADDQKYRRKYKELSQKIEVMEAQLAGRPTLRQGNEGKIKALRTVLQSANELIQKGVVEWVIDWFFKTNQSPSSSKEGRLKPSSLGTPEVQAPVAELKTPQEIVKNNVEMLNRARELAPEYGQRVPAYLDKETGKVVHVGEDIEGKFTPPQGTPEKGFRYASVEIEIDKTSGKVTGMASKGLSQTAKDNFSASVAADKEQLKTAAPKTPSKTITPEQELQKLAAEARALEGDVKNAANAGDLEKYRQKHKELSQKVVVIIEEQLKGQPTVSERKIEALLALLEDVDREIQNSPAKSTPKPPPDKPSTLKAHEFVDEMNKASKLEDKLKVIEKYKEKVELFKQANGKASAPSWDVVLAEYEKVITEQLSVGAKPSIGPTAPKTTIPKTFEVPSPRGVYVGSGGAGFLQYAGEQAMERIKEWWKNKGLSSGKPLSEATPEEKPLIRSEAITESEAVKTEIEPSGKTINLNPEDLPPEVKALQDKWRVEQEALDKLIRESTKVQTSMEKAKEEAIKKAQQAGGDITTQNEAGQVAADKVKASAQAAVRQAQKTGGTELQQKQAAEKAANNSIKESIREALNDAKSAAERRAVQAEQAEWLRVQEAERAKRMKANAPQREQLQNAMDQLKSRMEQIKGLPEESKAFKYLKGEIGQLVGEIDKLGADWKGGGSMLEPGYDSTDLVNQARKLAGYEQPTPEATPKPKPLTKQEMPSPGLPDTEIKKQLAATEAALEKGDWRTAQKELENLKKLGEKLKGTPEALKDLNNNIKVLEDKTFSLMNSGEDMEPIVQEETPEQKAKREVEQKAYEEQQKAIKAAEEAAKKPLRKGNTNRALLEDLKLLIIGEGDVGLMPGKSWKEGARESALQKLAKKPWRNAKDFVDRFEFTQQQIDELLKSEEISWSNSERKELEGLKEKLKGLEPEYQKSKAEVLKAKSPTAPKTTIPKTSKKLPSIATESESIVKNKMQEVLKSSGVSFAAETGFFTAFSFLLETARNAMETGSLAEGYTRAGASVPESVLIGGIGLPAAMWAGEQAASLAAKKAAERGAEKLAASLLAAPTIIGVGITLVGGVLITYQIGELIDTAITTIEQKDRKSLLSKWLGTEDGKKLFNEMQKEYIRRLEENKANQGLSADSFKKNYQDMWADETVELPPELSNTDQLIGDNEWTRLAFQSLFIKHANRKAWVIDNMTENMKLSSQRIEYYIQQLFTDIWGNIDEKALKEFIDTAARYKELTMREAREKWSKQILNLAEISARKKPCEALQNGKLLKDFLQKIKGKGTGGAGSALSWAEKQQMAELRNMFQKVRKGETADLPQLGLLQNVISPEIIDLFNTPDPDASYNPWFYFMRTFTAFADTLLQGEQNTEKACACLDRIDSLLNTLFPEAGGASASSPSSVSP
jgi:hypothetical protein